MVGIKEIDRKSDNESLSGESESIRIKVIAFPRVLDLSRDSDEAECANENTQFVSNVKGMEITYNEEIEYEVPMFKLKIKSLGSF